MEFVLCTVKSAVDGAITSVQTEGVIVENGKGMCGNDLGSVTSQSATSEHETAWIPPEFDGIVQFDVTDAFLFEVLPGTSDADGITDRVFEGDDDDVSELSVPDSCMRDFSIECVLESEPDSVGPSTSINLMATAMEMPATMEILHSNDVWVCDTAASNHFTKSKDGAYNSRKTNGVSQGMTGGHVEVSLLMDFTVTHYTKDGVEGNTFKMTDVSYNASYNFNLFSVSRCLVNGWTVTGDKTHVKLVSPCNTKSIILDLVVRTPKGAVHATVLQRHLEVANVSVTCEQMVLTLAQAHCKLGHADVEKNSRTAKALGWTLKDGVMDTCASCASGKAKQDAYQRNLKGCMPLSQAKGGTMIYP